MARLQPTLTSSINDTRTVRYFPERLPIGIHLAGGVVVIYVITNPPLDDYICPDCLPAI
jgi:hypothetical protein